jgi:hypothetical protein
LGVATSNRPPLIAAVVVPIMASPLDIFTAAGSVIVPQPASTSGKNTPAANFDFMTSPDPSGQYEINPKACRQRNRTPA